MTESDIELIMRQPFTMTCTDGDLVPFGQGKPHPRGNGAFARKIRSTSTSAARSICRSRSDR